MRAARWLIAIAITAGICWLFPLFHVVPLKTVTAEIAAEKFDATAFAETFWTGIIAARGGQNRERGCFVASDSSQMRRAQKQIIPTASA